MATNLMMTGVGDSGGNSIVTLDATNFNTASSSSSVSASITVGSGSNRILVAMVATTGSAISTIQDAGVDLILAQSNTGGFSTFAYYLLAPAPGSHTVTVTLSAGDNVYLSLFSLFGVNQVTPVDSHNGGHNSSGSPSTSLTVGNANALETDIADTFVVALSNNFGQTTLFLNTIIGSTHGASGYILPPLPLGSYTPTYGSSSGTWGMSAVTWNPA